jgi:hypothetical protein
MIQTAARRVLALAPWLNWLEEQLAEERAVVPAELA